MHKHRRKKKSTETRDCSENELVLVEVLIEKQIVQMARYVKMQQSLYRKYILLPEEKHIFFAR